MGPRRPGSGRPPRPTATARPPARCCAWPSSERCTGPLAEELELGERCAGARGRQLGDPDQVQPVLLAVGAELDALLPPAPGLAGELVPARGGVGRRRAAGAVDAEREPGLG